MIDDLKDNLDTQTSKLKRYFSGAVGLVKSYPNQAVGGTILAVLIITALIFWLVWPSQPIQPPREHIEQQTEAKIETKELDQKGTQKLEEAKSIEQRAENASRAAETHRKTIARKRDYAKEKQIEADNAGTTGGDDITVRDYTDLCTRSRSLGVSCDPDK